MGSKRGVIPLANFIVLLSYNVPFGWSMGLIFIFCTRHLLGTGGGSNSKYQYLRSRVFYINKIKNVKSSISVFASALNVDIH